MEILHNTSIHLVDGLKSALTLVPHVHGVPEADYIAQIVHPDTQEVTLPQNEKATAIPKITDPLDFLRKFAPVLAEAEEIRLGLTTPIVVREVSVEPTHPTVISELLNGSDRVRVHAKDPFEGGTIVAFIEERGKTAPIRPTTPKEETIFSKPVHLILR